jgi:CubicO group peptidase (beta-lactamase class C family)
VVSLLAGCSPAAGDRSRDASVVAAIDSIVEFTMAASEAPGMSIAVVRGRDTLALKGYGMANLEQGSPVTDRMVFQLGSVTKPFTAAAVLKLVEAGRLRLDTTLGDVAPDYVGPGRSVTIEQLLNHTSGIPTYTRAGSGYWELRQRSLSYDEMLAFFAGEPLEFEPGSGFAYNNSGYYLLGAIIERVTGETYADHLARTQFQPLGLAQTRHCGKPGSGLNRVQDYERRMGRPAPAERLAIENAGGGGALCGTPRELVHWVRALAGGKILSDSTYRRMSSPTVAGGTRHPYGLGLSIKEAGRYTGIGHSGGFGGFRAAFAHYPEADLTIVVLANGAAPVWSVGDEIAHHLLGVEALAPEGKAS